MTIAAGFRIENGILLCADSQVTGLQKYNAGKISHMERPGCKIAFALAGSVDYGTMAIQQCASAFDQWSDGSVDELAQLIHDTLTNVQERYVDTRPAAESEGCQFDLLVAIWHEAAGLRLYRTHRTSFVQISSWDAIGHGDYLARYLIEPVYRYTMRDGEAAIMAVQTVAAAKSYDAYCGGFTEILLIQEDGYLMRYFPHDIAEAESRIRDVEKHSKPLIFSISDKTISNEEFDKELDKYVLAIRRIRSEWRGQPAAVKIPID